MWLSTSRPATLRPSSTSSSTAHHQLSSTPLSSYPIVNSEQPGLQQLHLPRQLKGLTLHDPHQRQLRFEHSNDNIRHRIRISSRFSCSRFPLHFRIKQPLHLHPFHHRRNLLKPQCRCCRPHLDQRPHELAGRLGGQRRFPFRFQLLRLHRLQPVLHSGHRLRHRSRLQICL